MVVLWIDNPEVLFHKYNLWPRKDDSYEECMNSVSRFIIICCTYIALKRKRTTFVIAGLLFATILTLYSKRLVRKTPKLKEDIKDEILNDEDEIRYSDNFAHTVYGQINHNKKIYNGE